MIERRPFTPPDYQIGHGKVKGTSDYPTQGTSPRDVLLNPHTGKRRMGGRVSIETHSSAQSPEEALIEEEERHLHGEKQKATKEGNNEGFQVGVETVQYPDEMIGTHDSAVLHKSRGKRVGPEISNIGIGRM